MRGVIAWIGTVLVVMAIVGVARGGKVGDFLFGALLGTIVASVTVRAATTAGNAGHMSISTNPPAPAAPAVMHVAPQSATTLESSGTQGTAIYCTICGSSNPSWRWECEKCHARLARPDQLTRAPLHDRPGCVTVYAILLGIASGIIGLGGLAVGLVRIGQGGNAGAGLAIIAIALIVGALYGLLTRGIWRMRNWARVVVTVLQGMACVVNLLSACASLDSSSRTASGPPLLGALVGLAISGVITYWFASHGEHFN